MTQATLAKGQAAPMRHETLVTLTWHYFIKHRLAVIGMCVLGALILGAVFVPIVTHYDPGKTHILDKYLPPSLKHIMGTDGLGRDMFVRSMFKTRQGEALYRELTQASIKVPASAALALFMDGFTGDRRPALARIGGPTLVVVPQDNRLLGEYLQSKIEGSKLQVIEEAGHAVFLDRPQAFNQYVEEFLGGN